MVLIDKNLLFSYKMCSFSCVCAFFVVPLQRHLWSITNLGAKGTRKTNFNKMNIVKKEIILPDGRVITRETGKLAKQADGAVMATLGNTMVLAPVCSAKTAVPGTDFMPLTV